MVKYPQMEFAAADLVALFAHASAFAGARVVVSSIGKITPAHLWCVRSVRHPLEML